MNVIFSLERKSILFMYTVCLICFSLISCNNTRQQVEKALEMAGKNRAELEKVIDHYKEAGDPLKLKAAYFLIINMADKQFKNSKEFELAQKTLIDSIDFYQQTFRKFKNNEVNKYLLNLHTDSLIKTYFNKIYVDIQNDIEVINSDFLIKNIDLAFKAWLFPWSRKVNFDDFCKYILPYRCMEEKPEMLREYFMEMLKWLPDSMKGNTDPVKACFFVNNFLSKNKFTIKPSIEKFTGCFPPNFTVKTHIAGTCKDLTTLAAIAMRSVGIPVTIMSTPVWANYNVGHTFNIVLDTTGKWVYFMGTEAKAKVIKHKSSNGQIRRFYLGFYTCSKLFLNSFSVDNNYEDLTDCFIETSDIKVAINSKGITGNTPYFICTFADHDWKAVMTGQVNNDSATFLKMARKIVYLPVAEIENEKVPINYPVKLDSSGRVTYLIPNDKQKITMDLNSIFPVSIVYINRAKALKGGRFEISENRNFSNAKVLYQIDTVTSVFPQIIPIKEKKGTFVRFVLTKPKTQWDYTVRKISFFSGAPGAYTPIDGIKIGSGDFTKDQLNSIFGEGSFYRLVPYEKDLEQYLGFEKTIFLYKSDPSNIWVGLKLGKNQNVTAVGFTPETKHIIEPGLKYELFYWNNSWISLGIQTANSTLLNYKNVPSNALYLLHCIDKDKDERIFTYENGKQVFW